MRSRLLNGLLAAIGALGIGACDLDVPDLNNPGIDELEENPTPSGIAAAATGLLIGARAGTAPANGFVAQTGILGREAYNFDAADPRFVGELLAGNLSPASPFGGAFWTGPYANIKLAEIVLSATDAVVGFDDAQKDAIRGFTNTIKALDLLRVITTRDDIGAVIAVGDTVDDLGPVEDRDAVYAEIANLLDTGAGQLANGGMEFPFLLSSGFDGFDTPPTFLPFNRALRARVAAYQGSLSTGAGRTTAYNEALDALMDSFIDDGAMLDLDAGVFHSYSTQPGDATNGLTNPNIFAHPCLAPTPPTEPAIDCVVPGADPADTRFTSKVEEVPPEDAGGAQMLTSNLKFTAYTSPTAPIPIIRNEELILIRAEAEIFTGDLAGAEDDLNIIRTAAGLPPYAGASTEDALLDELLYNRRFSLLFEGGHRWIDLRRFGRLNELPIDLDGFVVNQRYPIPSAECDARPNEPACAMGSTE